MEALSKRSTCKNKLSASLFQQKFEIKKSDNMNKNNLDNYSVSRILRRCGQLGIPFKDVINSLYFSESSRKKPKSKIQYQDGINKTIGWGDNKKPLKEKDIIPYDESKIRHLLNCQSIKYVSNTGYWTFFCNPAKIEKNKFLSSSSLYDTYQITDWQKNQFQSGQLGLIYVSIDKKAKKGIEDQSILKSGVYAIVEILDSVKIRKKRTDQEIGKSVVKIRYIKNLIESPLLLETMESDDLIKNNRYLFRDFQVFSMPIDKNTFDRIIELTGNDKEIFENIEPIAVNNENDIKLEEEKYRFAPLQVKEVISKRIERGTISKKIKQLYNYKCKICEALGNDPLSFKKIDVKYYVETHHIVSVSKLIKGSLGISNLITVCANHHRQFHYGNLIIIENTKDNLKLKIDEKEINIVKKNFASA